MTESFTLGITIDICRSSYGKTRSIISRHRRMCGATLAATAIIAPILLSTIFAPGAGAQSSGSQFTPGMAQDPGVRTDPAGAGGPLASLSGNELLYFKDGLSRFIEVDSVAGTGPNEPGTGLGPGFNSNGCASCHAQPAVGGSSPALNPQIDAATDYGAKNFIPPFIRPDGPVREVRFPF